MVCPNACVLCVAAGKYVAPILYGGLGNVLFQLAACHVFGKELNVHCLVGFFKHFNRRYRTFDVWYVTVTSTARACGHAAQHMHADVRCRPWVHRGHWAQPCTRRADIL